MHGTYEANLTMHGCDVMVDLGTRSDDRVTGRLNAFAPGAKNPHRHRPVLDQQERDGRHRHRRRAADVLEQMIEEWKTSGAAPDRKALAAWWRQIEQWRARNPLAYRQNAEVIKPQHAIKRLWELTKGRHDVYITTEVGQHQM